MQEWAKLKGGKCLSKEYLGIDIKLTWMCAKAHTWDTMPAIIKQGSWCPACSNKLKGTIEQMRSIAMERGGKCLSKIYINTNVKLKWQCKKGHLWNSSPHSVKGGSWCPHCYGNVKHTLEQMKEIAKKQGGKCLSRKYVNKEARLKWKCSKGHTWQATAGSITHQKSWCPVCARKKMGNKGVRHNIEKMHSIAKERKGKCLSEKYVDVDTPLKWKCSRGHIWKASSYSVMNRGSWCRKCRYIDRRVK